MSLSLGRSAVHNTCIVAALSLTTSLSVAQQHIESAVGKSIDQMLADLKARAATGFPITTQSLGSMSRDLAFTPVAPCRIVDTRIAGGSFAAGETRTYDVDGSSFVTQGGFNGSCGIPAGQAAAVAMNITAVLPFGAGHIAAWALGPKPEASTLNFTPNESVANATIVPVVPGAGADFSIFASAGTRLVIDVLGYFAAPEATALDCVSVSSSVTAVPPNAYTAVDAYCPAGYSVTGGGTYPTEGTLGRPNIWTDGSPVPGGWRTWVNNQTGGNRSIQTRAQCCRVPGR